MDAWEIGVPLEAYDADATLGNVPLCGQEDKWRGICKRRCRPAECKRASYCREEHGDVWLFLSATREATLVGWRWNDSRHEAFRPGNLQELACMVLVSHTRL